MILYTADYGQKNKQLSAEQKKLQQQLESLRSKILIMKKRCALYSNG
jgi:hypothetical protein